MGYSNCMNYNNTLNSELINDWLEANYRKREYISFKLRISTSLLNKMIYEGHIPKEKTLKKLADLMEVEVNELLLPLDAA